MNSKYSKSDLSENSIGALGKVDQFLSDIDTIFSEYCYAKKRKVNTMKPETITETEATYIDGETGYQCLRCEYIFGNEEPGYVPTCSIDECDENIQEKNQGISDLIIHTKSTYPDLMQEMPARELVILGAQNYAKEFLQGKDYRNTFSNEDILIAASFISQYQEMEKRWIEAAKNSTLLTGLIKRERNWLDANKNNE